MAPLTSRAENPLTVRGEILQTIGVKNAQDIFRIKFVRVPAFAESTSFQVFTHLWYRYHSINPLNFLIR
jgi:hypothetical protein